MYNHSLYNILEHKSDVQDDDSFDGEEQSGSSHVTYTLPHSGRRIRSLAASNYNLHDRHECSLTEIYYSCITSALLY